MVCRSDVEMSELALETMGNIVAPDTSVWLPVEMGVL